MRILWIFICSWFEFLLPPFASNTILEPTYHPHNEFWISKSAIFLSNAPEISSSRVDGSNLPPLLPNPSLLLNKRGNLRIELLGINVHEYLVIGESQEAHHIQKNRRIPPPAETQMNFAVILLAHEVQVRFEVGFEEFEFSQWGGLDESPFFQIFNLIIL